jgi:hypothetical protein
MMNGEKIMFSFRTKLKMFFMFIRNPIKYRKNIKRRKYIY